jgi:spore coat protein U-like protein
MTTVQAASWRRVVIAASLAGCMAAWAQTSTTSLGVSATVLATCQLSSSNVAFGNYSSAQLDATGSVGVTCTNLAPYTVALDAGTGSGATTSVRVMTGPSSHTLAYALYQDPTRTARWGNTLGVDMVAGIGSGAAQTLTVYGRIPAGQAPAAGVYSDTVTVTVSY